MIYSLFPVKSTTHFGLAIGLLLSILFGTWTYAIPPDSSARKPLEYPRVRNSNAQASPHDGILNKNYQYLYQEYIRNHFQFGLRITDYNFDRLYESSRDDIYFIGSNDQSLRGLVAGCVLSQNESGLRQYLQNILAWIRR